MDKNRKTLKLHSTLKFDDAELYRTKLEGGEAFGFGLMLADNPYDGGKMEQRIAWFNGWYEGRRIHREQLNYESRTDD